MSESLAKRSRFNNLRIAVSAFFGVLTVLLVVLWVRSYWYSDYLVLWEGRPSQRTVIAQSIAGRIYVCKDMLLGTPPRYVSRPMDEDGDQLSEGMRQFENRFGFGYVSDGSFSAEIVPHWFAVTLGCVLAILPCCRLSPRFSLRTVLNVTTLLAVALESGRCRAMWLTTRASPARFGMTLALLPAQAERACWSATTWKAINQNGYHRIAEPFRFYGAIQYATDWHRNARRPDTRR